VVVDCKGKPEKLVFHSKGREKVPAAAAGEEKAAGEE
jgi:hypothetical protein